MEKKGIFLTHRHVSWLLSLFIMSSFLVFVTGYFLGKKKAVEKFYNKVDQDSLADHIYYSVCSIYENDAADIEQKSTEDVADSGAIATTQQTAVTTQELTEETDTSVATAIEVPAQESPKQLSGQEKKENFYAELIGFGTLRAANRFCDKLKKQGFAVVLKKRRSRSAKGKTIYWYQVITEKFDNKSDLIAFVDIIKGKEKLKGIRIVQC